MVGILPSGIGIGTGAVITGDDALIEELVAIERERRGLTMIRNNFLYF